MPTRGTERDKYLKKLDKLNEFGRLVENLRSNEFTISHLEMAYRYYIKTRKDIPEGVRNLLVEAEGAGSLKFAQQIKTLVGNVHLGYLRGRQEGKDIPEAEWDGTKKPLI